MMLISKTHLLLLLLTIHMIKVALSHFCCRTTLQCQMSPKSAMNNRQFECALLQYSEQTVNQQGKTAWTVQFWVFDGRWAVKARPWYQEAGNSRLSRKHRKRAVTQCQTTCCRNQQGWSVGRSEMVSHGAAENWTNGLCKVAQRRAMKKAVCEHT